MHCPKIIAIVSASMLLAACATTPSPLAGDFANSSPRSARDHGDNAQRVRWGGEIIRVDPGMDSTCLEILAHELRPDARPQGHDTDEGRFIACRKGFYDPEVFARSREVTITGVINGNEIRRVGEYDYTYPRVAADVIYLWPPRVARYDAAYPWGFGPWSDPLWSSGWGWWGPPVVIVHRHRNGPRK